MVSPNFNADGNFPPGKHTSTWEEARRKLAFTSRRLVLFKP